MPTEEEVRHLTQASELVIEMGQQYIASLETLNVAYAKRIAELENALRQAGRQDLIDALSREAE